MIFGFFALYNPDKYIRKVDECAALNGKDQASFAPKFMLLFHLLLWFRVLQLIGLIIREMELKKKTYLDKLIGKSLYQLAQLGLFVACIFATVYRFQPGGVHCSGVDCEGEACNQAWIVTGLFLKIFVIVHWVFIGLLCCTPCLVALAAACCVKYDTLLDS